MNKVKNDIGLIISELKKIIREEEMRKYKTTIEHEKYYLESFEKIELYPKYIRIARVKKKPIRLFFDEFSVLIDYTKIKYKNNRNIKWRWCGGNESPEANLKYDGIIERNGKVIEKIEIVSPLHCEEDVKAGEELNIKGYYTYDCCLLDDAGRLNKNKIINNVDKKNLKKEYDETITLLIVFDKYNFLLSSEIQDYINSIVKELKLRTHIFKNVYLIIDKYDGSNFKKDSYLIKIK